MGAPDISKWIWPDASQGRAPTTAVKVDLSNPLVAGLADYIIPSNPASFNTVSGTLGQTLDPLGLAFAGTMRLEGVKNAVNTANYTMVIVTRSPPSLSGFQVACSLDGSFSNTPWMGFSSSGATVSNSSVDSSTPANPSTIYVITGVYNAGGYDAYVNGVHTGTSTLAGTGGTTGTLTLMAYNGGGFDYGGTVLAALAFNRLLSPAEVGALGTAQDVFALFQPATLGLYVPVTQGAVFAAAGTEHSAATAALTTGVNLSAAATQHNQATSALTTAVTLAAAATETATSGSALTTAIRLAGTASEASSASAALATAYGLSAQGQQTSSASGALQTAILLAASASQQSSATANLPGAGGLAAVATQSNHAVSTLTTQILLLGAASEQSQASADLTSGSAVQLIATATQHNQAVAALQTSLRLAAAANQTSSAVVYDGDNPTSMYAAGTEFSTATAALGSLSPPQKPYQVTYEKRYFKVYRTGSAR